MMTNQVLDRLSPLPKRIEVSGCLQLPPTGLAIAAHGDDVWTQRAARELSDYVAGLTKTRPPVVRETARSGQTVLHLVAEAERCRFAQNFVEPFFEDFHAAPGFQSYRVKSLEDAGGLVLQGLSAEGVYWGMKTLKQLIRFEDRRLVLPCVRIVDGADMEQRGIWTQPFGEPTCPFRKRPEALAHYRQWIDWMSDRKLNLMEVMTVGEGGGIGFHSRRHPEFQHSDWVEREYLLKQLLSYARDRGVRVFPIFSHAEHFDFVVRKFPELAARDAVSHHGRSVKIALNFFHKKTAEVLYELAEDVLTVLDPPGLCFWLAENRLHSLPVKARTKSEFLQEAGVFYDIVLKLRRSKPELGIKILLSQGSFPENLELIRAFPPDVEWIYYSGERFGTYNMRPMNPIHRDMAVAAQEGRWISLCNGIRGIPGRPTVLSRLQANIVHAIEAGLKGLDGMSYSHPGDEAALFVAAEYAWNAYGRPLDDTLRAHAVDQGVGNPERQVEAYRLFDSANYAQTSRDSLGIGQPFGVFSRFYNMLERIRDNDKVDELIMLIVDGMETDELPALAQAEADIEKALAAADPKRDAIFRLRCEYLLRVVRISQNIARAFYVNGREKCWDLYKGDWADFRAELKGLFKRIRIEAEAGTPAYKRLVKLEQWNRRTQAGRNPLLGVAELAESIDVNKVTSSRD